MSKTTSTGGGGRLDDILTHPPALGRPDSGPGKKWKNLPSFDELPHFKDFAGCAWDLWGEGDQLGTVNMLTDDVVARAMREEVW